MTAPAYADHQPDQPDQPDGLSPAEAAVVAALAVWFASTAAVTAVTLPGVLAARLVGLGLSTRAVRAATRIVMGPPLTGRRRHGSPTTRTTTARAVGADEPEMRARYLLAAAKRLTTAALHGVFPQALRLERGYLDQHVQAGRNRARAAAALDRVAADHGPWLVWHTHHPDDGRVTPDCAVLDGAVFTVDNIPGGLPPGARHPRCRCYATGLADTFGAQPTVST